MGQYIVDLCAFSNSIRIEDYIDHDNCEIFHYTSPQGLSGIIKNDVLWFSDRAYLNDKSESMYVIQLCLDEVDKLGFTSSNLKEYFIKECTERLTDPQDNHFYPYLCSFSLDSDSLCLWNYYTKGAGIKGYNLKFKSHDLLNAFDLHGCNEPDTHPTPIGGKVVYEREEQIEIIKKIVRKFEDFSKKDDYGKTE